MHKTLTELPPFPDDYNNVKRSIILKRLAKKIKEDTKVSETFPRIYYPETSNKPISEMKPLDFILYFEECKKDLLKIYNLTKKNYLAYYR